MKFFYLVICSLLFTPQILLAEEPVNVSYFGSTAIGGHDSKAYHALSRGDEARKGSKQFVVEWKGAKWQFLSAEDSQQFAASPEKYAPAYNGFCANALSLGEGLVKANGKYWAVFNEQLYLFYAPRGAQRWLDGDYSVYKREADQAWALIVESKN